MSDGVPRPQAIPSESDFLGLDDEDCVDLEEGVAQHVRWLYEHRCLAQARKLKAALKRMPSTPEEAAPPPEPALAALNTLQDVLDYIASSPPRGLKQEEYAELRRLRNPVRADVLHRTKLLTIAKAQRDKAIENAEKRMLTPGDKFVLQSALQLIPGAIIYRGHRSTLSGKPRQVLKALSEARHRTLTLNDLQSEVWNRSDSGEEAVRSAVKSARAALPKAVKAAGVVGPTDPIPAVDRGLGRTAWRLDLT
jgi:hypothetical protein